MCIEAMLGISLYSSLYLKLAKTLCLSFYLCFLFNKIGEQECGIDSALKCEWGRAVREVGRVVDQTMYTHASKCKNDKIKNNNNREEIDT
jgi:hypothetical protein